MVLVEMVVRWSPKTSQQGPLFIQGTTKKIRPYREFDGRNSLWRKLKRDWNTKQKKDLVEQKNQREKKSRREKSTTDYILYTGNAQHALIMHYHHAFYWEIYIFWQNIHSKSKISFKNTRVVSFYGLILVKDDKSYLWIIYKCIWYLAYQIELAYFTLD